MAKNIVILLDGTNQEGGRSAELNTNVYKMYTMLEERSPRQVVFYDRGVGAGSRKIAGNVGGAGISNRILRAYRFIHDHYESQDRIFLFGFSRGATEVRSLANFLEIFQFLPRSRPDLIDKAWKIYKTRPPFRWWARRRIVRYRRNGIGQYWWEVLIRWLIRRGTEDLDLRNPFDVMTALLPERTRFAYRKLHGHTWEERIAELKEKTKDLTSEQIANQIRDASVSYANEIMPDHVYGEDPAADAIWSDINDVCWHLNNLCGVFDDKSDPAAWLRTFIREDRAAQIMRASGSSRRGARLALHFLGCFDTVAALGLPFPRLRAVTDRIPGMYHSFHNLKLPTAVNHACQALALDEERRAFSPEVWKADKFQPSHQVWFSGVHTDVGGGYLENGLSEVTLSWMLRMGHTAGLLLKRQGSHFHVFEDPKGVLHDSRDSLLKKWLFGKQTRKPFELGDVVVHRSVIERMNSNAPNWQWQDGRPVEVAADRYRNRLRSVLGNNLDSGLYQVDELDPVPFDLDKLVEAQEEMWRAWAKTGYRVDWPSSSLWDAWELAENGERDKLEKLLADVPKNCLQAEIGLLYGKAGDLDRAFAYLNEAFARHPTSLRALSIDPRITRSLREDARFDELLKKLGHLGRGYSD